MMHDDDDDDDDDDADYYHYHPHHLACLRAMFMAQTLKGLMYPMAL